MSTSPNLGLYLTPADDLTTNAHDWAMRLTGEDGGSNMMIIDQEIVKRPQIHLSPTEPAARAGDLWYQELD